MTTRLITSSFGTPEQIDSIADFFLAKEQYVLDTYPYVGNFFNIDAYINTSSSLVSTRSGSYNAFQFSDELPILNDLKDAIKIQYEDYLQQTGLSVYATDNPAISCWFNIFRKNESVSYHCHSHSANSFISGTMALQADGTSTYFKYDDGEVVKVQNTPGTITLFPCNVYHWSDVHTEDIPRVTLGFDIMFDKEHSRGSEMFYNALISL